jgi:hypothetical protein
VQIPVVTREYSDYTLSPDLTETAVQDAIPTESCGNFGLKRIKSDAGEGRAFTREELAEAWGISE